MALIEIGMAGGQIDVRAWPILDAHIDLTPGPAHRTPNPDAIATPARIVHSLEPAQPIRQWCRRQVDQRITAVSQSWLTHVQFLQPAPTRRANDHG